MRNTKWIYKENDNINLNGKYSKDLLTILDSRNIKTDEEIEVFLNGGLENLRNPYDLADMEKAVDIILNMKAENKNIWIYGDYDVDGITSTSLLYRAFKEIGINVNYYIPLRDEGYGLNKGAIEEIKNNGGDLVITVDCGISSVEEVRFANEIGLPMIITDHHEINNELPAALSVINVKREDNKYSFKSLAGVGTAFMLVMALYEKLSTKEKSYKFLDIVAVGTIADLVPLVEDNRILVKKGLEVLKRTKWTGLTFLLRKLYEDYQNKKFDTYDVGFIIAPIFNAAGRLEDAKKSVELFITEDNKQADIISYELINQNEERKTIQNKIYEEVVKEIEENTLDKKGIIIVAKEKLHHGVIGIVASKIVDRYYKPTIIMEIKPQEGVAVASCRSIEGLSIIEGLNSVRDLLVKYGGHTAAAGFTIEISKIEEFSQKLEDFVNSKLIEEDFIKPLKIDKKINLFKVGYDFLDEISLLEPFGFGNPTPLFAINNCNFSNLRKIGKDQTHLMLNIIKDKVQINNCVWFGAADMFNYINDSNNLDVVCKLKTEIFRDKYQFKIFIEDIKKSDESNIKNINTSNELDIYDTVMPLKSVFYTRKKIKGDVKFLYFEDKVYITENKITVGELDEATAYILTTLKNNYNYKFKCVVKEIKETGENFNVFIEILRDYSFSSYKLKSGEIFGEIKEHLLGNLPYNSFQRNVLAGIFKKNINVLGKYKENRGVGVLIKTIGLYYKSIGKKSLLVYSKGKDEKVLNNLSNYIEVSQEYQEGYDFYIYLDKENNNMNEKYLILIREDEEILKKFINKEDLEIIEDKYILPSNINIIDESELKNYSRVWLKKLSRKSKEEIHKLLKNNEIIYGSQDICHIL